MKHVTGFLEYRAVRPGGGAILSTMLLPDDQAFSGWPPITGPYRIEGDFRVEARILPDGKYRPIASYRDEGDGWKIEPAG